MSRDVKWGVLGLGKIAHKFVSDLQLVESCKLVAVASSNVERAKEFSKKYGVDRAYGTYESLYKDEEVDIIYIASLNQDHFQHTLDALRHQKAVMCEKPLGINQHQVSEMIRTAETQKVFLMEALWTRFNPLFEQLLHWIESGEIGVLRYINASFSFYGLDRELDSRLFNPEKGGGSLLDIGIYPLFLAYQLLKMPISLKATAVKYPSGVDEQIAMILTYEQAQAVLYSSFTHDEDMRAAICGEKGEIYIDSRWHEASTITLVKQGVPKRHTFDFLGKGYTYEILEANECVRNGKQQSSKWSLKDSLALAQMMDEVRAQNKIYYPGETK